MIPDASDKTTLRQQALYRRRNLSEAQRLTASKTIRNRLIDRVSQTPVHARAPLLLYRSLGDEVETGPLFVPGSGLPGRRVFAPVTHRSGHIIWRRTDGRTRWQRGDFGVLEPASGSLWPHPGKAGEPAVLVCPLVGFDRAGNRLGMGKGCFDRWLGEMKGHILLTIGLAFACQECETIPAETHDIPLDIIITEGETITCRNS